LLWDAAAEDGAGNRILFACNSVANSQVESRVPLPSDLLFIRESMKLPSELTMGHAWVVDQMGHQNLMGHMGHDP
jgi:hypothetical protein